MKFAAIIDYTDDQGLIDRIRPQHRQYLASLREQGRLAASGPFTDDSGALIVYEAASLEEAVALLRNDPFLANGVFRSYRMHPWSPVLCNRELFPA